jgi:hypothetical protein
MINGKSVLALIPVLPALGLLAFRRYLKGYLGALMALLSTLLLAYASFGVDSRINPLMPALKSNWLLIHVVTAFLGYAARPPLLLARPTAPAFPAAAALAGQPHLLDHRPGIFSADRGDRHRSGVGRNRLGPLLELGPQGNLVADYLVHLRRPAPRPALKRLAWPPHRMAGGAGLHGGPVHLLRRQLSPHRPPFLPHLKKKGLRMEKFSTPAYGDVGVKVLLDHAGTLLGLQSKSLEVANRPQPSVEKKWRGQSPSHKGSALSSFSVLFRNSCAVPGSFTASRWRRRRRTSSWAHAHPHPGSGTHFEIGGDLLGFQPGGRHLLLYLVCQGFQLLLLGLNGGLIRLLRLRQGRQFRMLDHHLLAQTGGVGIHLFIEVEDLARLLRGQIHHPGDVAHALTHGLSRDGRHQTQTQRHGQDQEQR